MPTATSHMSVGTRAGKPSAPAKDSPTKVDAEGAGETGAHPSRIPTAGPISQIGVLAPSGAPCPHPQLLRDRAQAGGSSREEPAPSFASPGEGHACRSEILDHLADALGIFHGRPSQ